MDCEKTQKLLPEWMDSTLDAGEGAALGQHLARCESCRNEFKAYARAWNGLKAWKDIEPDPGYISRFWTRLSTQKTLLERFTASFVSFSTTRWVLPVTAAALIAFAMFSVTIHQTSVTVKTEKMLSMLSAEDMEFVENLELAEHFELLQSVDLLEDIDVLADDTFWSA